MNEYVLENYFLLLYFYAFLLSVAKYSLYYDTILKYLPVIIIYTLLSEILGLIIRDVDYIAIIYKENYYEYNTIIFNLFDIIYYLYFLYIFYHTIKKSMSRNIIKYGAAIFVLACIINLFFQDILTEPQSYAIIVGSIFLVYAAVI